MHMGYRWCDCILVISLACADYDEKNKNQNLEGETPHCQTRNTLRTRKNHLPRIALHLQPPSLQGATRKIAVLSITGLPTINKNFFRVFLVKMSSHFVVNRVSHSPLANAQTGFDANAINVGVSMLRKQGPLALVHLQKALADALVNASGDDALHWRASGCSSPSPSSGVVPLPCWSDRARGSCNASSVPSRTCCHRSCRSARASESCDKVNILRRKKGKRKDSPDFGCARVIRRHDDGHANVFHHAVDEVLVT